MNNAKTEPPVLRENISSILLQKIKNHHITSVKKHPTPGTLLIFNNVYHLQKLVKESFCLACNHIIISASNFY